MAANHRMSKYRQLKYYYSQIVYNYTLYKLIGFNNMVTAVKKWGNSLGIRLPKTIANEMKLNEGTNLQLIYENDKIQLSKIAPEYSLDDFLSAIDTENIHSEFETHSAVGNELC